MEEFTKFDIDGASVPVEYKIPEEKMKVIQKEIMELLEKSAEQSNEALKVSSSIFINC